MDIVKSVPHGWDALGNTRKVPLEVLDKYLNFFDVFDKLKADFFV